ncbi:hypothetical protein ABW19_dt0204801 [Dactylella cylindrospora]|nr:hypothetical protein ABW19_dt0204801 [Dactylella cylindrospora]
MSNSYPHKPLPPLPRTGKIRRASIPGVPRASMLPTSQLFSRSEVNSGSGSTRNRILDPSRVPVAPATAVDPLAGLRVDTIEEFLDGRSLGYTLQNRAPESLLRILARSIYGRSPRNQNEAKTFRRLRQFAAFTASCRDSDKPFATTKSLTYKQALRYYRLTSEFLHAVACKREPLKVLRYIFNRELNIPEKAVETRKLVLTLVAELPYVFKEWVNIWIGIVEADWGSVWKLIEFVRFLEKRGSEWRSERGKWASLCLARMAERKAKMLLHLGGGEFDDTDGGEGHIGFWVTGSINQVTMDKGKGKAKNRDDALSVLMGELQLENEVLPDSDQVNLNVGERRVADRSRPAGIYYTPEVKGPPPSLIDIIVSKYAELPRIKSDKERKEKEEAVRRRKSEEEYNRELRQNYNQQRLRERLEGLTASGMLGEEAREDGIEEIFGKRKESPKAEEMIKLHMRIVQQDEEIEDNEFERWASHLLEEGEGEEDRFTDEDDKIEDEVLGYTSEW